jgi:hypothetical protein
METSGKTSYIKKYIYNVFLMRFSKFHFEMKKKKTRKSILFSLENIENAKKYI